MTLQRILRVKGSFVHTVKPDASLDSAIEKLVQFNIGSLIVTHACEDCHVDDILGIITERDILRAAARRLDLYRASVHDCMTRDVVTGMLDQSITEIMGLMTKHRLRHLPVIENSRLCGIISIGDVVKKHHEEMMLENHYLKNYIQS